ncbi:SGNH/GDSL hydrolase family protein [Alisedimentitalea sp. MJ-SS2]|uniref:SGNH/GDSL hydrolase family protein n=1 Tax=Aliisedimentitalea sp. MJ-SS2 TaxID=3049795 RepID=UPI002913B8F2|nr:SGNH/GDSL hydrolase family protein [Alisedimentitalea sp. MJ-SS2]MDU8929340.1 SGNH/GDSL hydrolase family protein [Alisedimentitalea sp. MJ-SS2]
MIYTLAILALLGLPLSDQPISAKEQAQPRILVIGDSLLASHSISGRSVGHYLSRILSEPVRNNPVAGARMIYNLPISGAMGMSIPKQFRPGQYDWVVLNGGGNDLWLGCGCNKCDRKLNRLISADGRRGVIPGLVSRIRKSGARVLYVGYLRSPGFDTPIENCKDEGDALEARIARLAALDRGIVFHPITDLVPSGDLSFHAVDRIHPSLKASHAIARRLAQVIRAN